MARFSDESKFVMKNHDTIEEIITAKAALDQELSEALNSLEGDLRCSDWWESGWEFRSDPGEAWVSRRQWRIPDDHAVAIGIERFTGDGLFGRGEAARLYVWVPEELPKLNERLLAALAVNEEELPGDLALKINGYVLTAIVAKCPPGAPDPEAYLEDVREQALKFIGHCAGEMMRFDTAIRNSAQECSTV